ncbi:MAG: hypothetical protein KGK33_04755 [Hyphomicrobiales bacterium]|nr:hypothetical protein [Hyphomicrobiales bacterium]
MRRALVFGENSVSPVEQIDLQFEAVRVQPPVSHTTLARIQTLGSFEGTFNVLCATDHNALLEAFVGMTVDAEQIFEKAHSISAHDFHILLATPPPPVRRLKPYRPIGAHVTPA